VSWSSGATLGSVNAENGEASRKEVGKKVNNLDLWIEIMHFAKL